MVAVAIAQHRDDRARPELRSVLAHAPPEVFASAHSQRRLQQVIGLSVLAISGSEELRKAPPHDLAARIPLQPLRARVPRLNSAVAREHIDRITLDGLDK